jgi:hypothetical protein
MTSYHKTRQNTDRIACTFVKVLICRAFSWSISLLIITHWWMGTDRCCKYRPRIAHKKICCFAGISSG